MREAAAATDLAALAKAALYYEPAVDALVPPGRRGSAAYWCQSNRASPALRGLATLAECLAVVDGAVAAAAATITAGADLSRAVVEAVNLFPAASAYGRAHGKHHDFVRGKVYKWDLTGMMPAGRGTVEFRQPAGSLTADDAAGWITLAVAFVAGALVVGPGLGGGSGGSGNGSAGASVEELWELLATGAEMVGWDGLGAVEGLFARRSA